MMWYMIRVILLLLIMEILISMVVFPVIANKYPFGMYISLVFKGLPILIFIDGLICCIISGLHFYQYSINFMQTVFLTLFTLSMFLYLKCIIRKIKSEFKIIRK